jgi:hypothetical protein
MISTRQGSIWRHSLPTRLGPLALSNRPDVDRVAAATRKRAEHLGTVALALGNGGNHECSDATFDGATSKSMRQSFSRLFRRVFQA